MADTDAAPYEPEDLKTARETLTEIGNQPEAERSVGLAALSALKVDLPYEHTHVIRKRDLIDLFDTTPDLAGNDIDIDRFIREIEDSDVRVFWRAWKLPKGNEPPPEDEPAPRREELCPAPIGEFRDFFKKHSGQVWRWDFLERQWEKIGPDKIVPGQVYLVHAHAGGYSAEMEMEMGWDPRSKTSVEPIAPTGAKGEAPDATEDDRLSRVDVWQTIAQHTNEVCRKLEEIVSALALAKPDANVLRKAARWHDWGKAHRVFQDVLPQEAPEFGKLWAKAKGTWKRYRAAGRPHFRHELASALAVLQRLHEHLKLLSDDDLNLVTYLIAAHHGKVRLSIRSLSNETRSDHNRRFARGVWDGDTLPDTNLGAENGKLVFAPAVTLSLEPMELGLCEQPPFAGQPSWAERMIRLRDALGPFRLAYLEAILRAADMRASAAAEQRAVGNQPIGTNAAIKEVDHE